MKLELPETRRRIESALAERRSEGFSDVVTDIDAKPFIDRARGPYIRFTLQLEDGHELIIDSVEAAPMVELTMHAHRPH